MDRKNQINLLCQFLKTWRNSRRISQEQVYIATGIDVSNYEIGRCEPGLYNMLMLCDFYGVSVSWLLKSTEETDSGLLSVADFLDKAQSR